MNALVATLDQALVPVMLVIGIGYLWRLLSPAGLEAPLMRRVLGGLVMYITYPALAFSVVATAELSMEVLWVPGMTMVSIFAGVLLGRLIAPLAGIQGRADVGALLLACGFGNLISMGIPVVAAVFGMAATRYAIYADIMGLAPLLWTLGFWIALRYGGDAGGAVGLGSFVGRLFRLPPLWAFMIALGLNLAGVSLPVSLDRAATMVGNATMPCMLLTVGMSLSVSSVWRYPRAIFVVALLKLILLPLLLFLGGRLLVGEGEMLSATTLLAAMPTMMATIILSEEYGLNTELLATLMVGNTLLFFTTFPVWLYFLTGG